VRAHGVEVRPVDVGASEWECTLEGGGGSTGSGGAGGAASAGGPALRLGLRMVKGIAEAAAQRIVAARAAAPFRDVDDAVGRAGLSRREAQRLAEAGAFGTLAAHRRAAFWQAAPARQSAPLFERAPPPEVAPPPLPPPHEAELVVADYATTGLTLHSHPLHFLRPHVAKLGGAPCSVLTRALSGARIAVAGLVLHRQKPGTASGVLFMTLEDESGSANVIVREREQQRHRSACIGGRLLLVRGKVERVGEVVHLLAERVTDLTELVRRIETRSRDFR